MPIINLVYEAPSIRMYKYLRWTITANRNNINVTQMSEFEIYNNSGTKMARPSGTTITGNITGPSGETVDKIIDGSTSTKYCPNGSLPIIITITLGEPIKFNDYHTYKWYTANDESGRDPVSWTIEVSEDGTNWTLVDTVTNATITTTRYALAYTGTMVRPSSGGWKPGANTLLYLPLKEDFLDHSGNSIAMTNNNVVLEDGFGKFNGSSSYLCTTNDFSLSSNPFTVSFWIKANNTNTSGLINQNRYSGGYKGWNFYIVDQKIRTELTPSGGQISTGVISASSWYHIVMVVPSSGNRVVYRNGVQENTGSNSLTFISRPVYIGTPAWNSSDISGSGLKFNGYMSNIIIENRERTAQEVLNYYNQTKSNYESALKSYEEIIAMATSTAILAELNKAPAEYFSKLNSEGHIYSSIYLGNSNNSGQFYTTDNDAIEYNSYSNTWRISLIE